MKYPFDKVGGRKFTVTMTCIIVSTALLVLGYVESSQFQHIVVYTTGLYLTANVAQKKVLSGEGDQIDRGAAPE